MLSVELFFRTQIQVKPQVHRAAENSSKESHIYGGSTINGLTIHNRSQFCSLWYVPLLQGKL